MTRSQCHTLDLSDACNLAAIDYTTLLAARIFLGVYKKRVLPTLTLISSQWYIKSEQVQGRLSDSLVSV